MLTALAVIACAVVAFWAVCTGIVWITTRIMGWPS